MCIWVRRRGYSQNTHTEKGVVTCFMLTWGTAQKSVLVRLPLELTERDASSCSKKAAVLSHKYREGRTAGLFPCRFLLGKSHWESLVSPSFLRTLDSPGITYSRGLCKTRKPQQKGLLLAFPTMSRRTVQCLCGSASLPRGIDSLYWPKRTLCLQSLEQVWTTSSIAPQNKA